MRGYILPIVIALLLAAPLLWRSGAELSMPNQVIGVAPVAAPNEAAVEAPAVAAPAVRLLAVVPLAEDDEGQAPTIRDARLWSVGYDPSAGAQR